MATLQCQQRRRIAGEQSGRLKYALFPCAVNGIGRRPNTQRQASISSRNSSVLEVLGALTRPWQSSGATACSGSEQKDQAPNRRQRLQRIIHCASVVKQCAIAITIHLACLEAGRHRSLVLSSPMCLYMQLEKSESSWQHRRNCGDCAGSITLAKLWQS